jgi:hypothetical protein
LSEVFSSSRSRAIANHPCSIDGNAFGYPHPIAKNSDLAENSDKLALAAVTDTFPMHSWIVGRGRPSGESPLAGPVRSADPIERYRGTIGRSQGKVQP